MYGCFCVRYSPPLLVKIVKLILLSVLQLLLVLLNLLSARKSKTIQQEGLVSPPLLPPYTEPNLAKLPKAELQREKEEWFDHFDGKSLMSTSTLTDNEKSSRATDA